MRRNHVLLMVYLTAAALPALAVESGSVRGVVRDDAGRPLAGAKVVVLEAGKESAETESGGDGAFVLAGLAPGSVAVEARLPGYVIAVREAVAVVAGEAVDVAFTLVPIATPLDEIVVSSTFSILKDEPISASALSREEIRDLPHFADDL